MDVVKGSSLYCSYIKYLHMFKGEGNCYDGILTM